MAHFLIGGAAAQLEARDRDRALQQYQYERNMERQLANDAYRREQDAYARQMGEERWNYSRMDNDRQYRFNRDKFNWARQDADRSYALNKRNMDFNYERGVKLDAREDADRWALGLNRGEYQRALAVTDGTAQPYYPENAINPYQREAVRLRRAADERAALNYEQTKTQRAAKPAADAVKAENEKRYNQAALELGQYELPKNLKPEAAAKAVADIAKENGVPMKEAVRLVAEQYGWNASETAAGQNENTDADRRELAGLMGESIWNLDSGKLSNLKKAIQETEEYGSFIKAVDENGNYSTNPEVLKKAELYWNDRMEKAGFDPDLYPNPYELAQKRMELEQVRSQLNSMRNKDPQGTYLRHDPDRTGIARNDREAEVIAEAYQNKKGPALGTAQEILYQHRNAPFLRYKELHKRYQELSDYLNKKNGKR